MKISILYAYRNREKQRIENSLKSLVNQNESNFEVVFVDYGSDDAFATRIQKVIEGFSFASYHYMAHPGLLWNKSKALNYAASKAKGEFVFVADVDICFDINAVSKMTNLAKANMFSLFKLSYLKQEITQQEITKGKFNANQIKHHGDVNGMVLVSRENFLRIEGYDEFYHFYGSEDIDFYERLKNAGIQKEKNSDTLFFHQWHPIYNAINDAVLEVTPRFFNIKKINQQHFLFQQKQKAVKPILHQKINQYTWEKNNQLLTSDATKSIIINNDHAKVWHLFKVVLPTLKKDIVHIRIEDDNYFSSLKYRLKKQLKKPDRLPMPMKAVNDLMLEEIVLKYRHHNYTFKIGEDLKSITLIIQL
ncbi:N-terminal domain of galactosyltransferase [Psychroflexus salarius]|uniref:N-terminal domain of galactosyltransferase n=1 Tax=Psychroflexus salarius TaxID=1155689 RepID=A0A1M4X3R6_9FLAO|nr:glycosyltransferase [Psychroflexus salarius]SHE88121.1 N-terminal domain of galactosyltransferase [Psychroflexus salarius]